MEEENNIQIEQRESIKLVKNSRGYNWELKILNVSGKQINDEDIRRLDGLNEELKKRYGSNE